MILTVWSSGTCYGNVLWGYGERRVRFLHCAQIFHCIASGKQRSVLTAWESVINVYCSWMCRRKCLIAVSIVRNLTWSYPFLDKMIKPCQLSGSIQDEKQSCIPWWNLPKMARGVGKTLKNTNQKRISLSFSSFNANYSISWCTNNALIKVFLPSPSLTYSETSDLSPTSKQTNRLLLFLASFLYVLHLPHQYPPFPTWTW